MKNIITNLISSLLTFALFGCTMTEMATDANDQRIVEDERSIFCQPQLQMSFESSSFQTGWYKVSDTANEYKRALYRSDDIYFIDKEQILGAKNILGVEIYASNGGSKHFGLVMKFDDIGTQAWSIATERAIGKKLAFILNDTLLHVSTINAQITGGIAAINREIYSRQELEKFQKSIQQTKE